MGFGHDSNVLVMLGFSLSSTFSVLPSSSFRVNCAQNVRWRGSNQLLTQARSGIDVCILYVCGFLSRMPDHANCAYVTEHSFLCGQRGSVFVEGKMGSSGCE